MSEETKIPEILAHVPELPALPNIEETPIYTLPVEPVVEEKSTGEAVKNAAVYSTTSGVLASALIILLNAENIYTIEEIGILTAALSVVINVLLVIGKKYFDK